MGGGSAVWNWNAGGGAECRRYSVMYWSVVEGLQWSLDPVWLGSKVSYQELEYE